MTFLHSLIWDYFPSKNSAFSTNWHPLLALFSFHLSCSRIFCWQLLQSTYSLFKKSRLMSSAKPEGRDGSRLWLTRAAWLNSIYSILKIGWLEWLGPSLFWLVDSKFLAKSDKNVKKIFKHFLKINYAYLLSKSIIHLQ